MFNATQTFHAQVQYLKFHGGQGIRYITQLDQAYLPVNNLEVIYTFQGLTDDGQYYISAILPITNGALPNSDQVTADMQSQLNDPATYYQGMAQSLNAAKAQDFSPNLSLLDAMLQSLEINEQGK